VHCLEHTQSGTRVAMIGSHYFIREFWKVTKEEKDGVRSMMKRMYKEEGILCFPCYGQHHAIVFYVHEGDLITPEKFCSLLKSKPRLITLLSEHAGEDLVPWGSSYISVHGSNLTTEVPPKHTHKTHHHPHDPTGTLMRTRPENGSGYVSQRPVGNGVVVKVLSETGDFSLVQKGDQSGWVRSKYLH
jgi:hypothetical protein